LLNLSHLLVQGRLHVDGVLNVDLLLLLLLLLEVLLGAIVVCWRRHRSGGGHGISGARIHRSSEIRMGQCFGGGDTL